MRFDIKYHAKNTIDLDSEQEEYSSKVCPQIEINKNDMVIIEDIEPEEVIATTEHTADEYTYAKFKYTEQVVPIEKSSKVKNKHYNQNSPTWSSTKLQEVRIKKKKT